MQAGWQGFKEVKGNKALSRKSAHKKADPLKNRLFLCLVAGTVMSRIDLISLALLYLLLFVKNSCYIRVSVGF